MSNDPAFSLLNDVKAGDVIEATVIRMDDGQGNILLSKKEANEVLSWDVLEQMKEEKTDVTVKVSEAVNGGAVAYVEGIRGFIPASQLDLNYVEDPSAYIGKTLKVRVITVDPVSYTHLVENRIALGTYTQCTCSIDTHSNIYFP